jgi:hypothetical protein
MIGFIGTSITIILNYNQLQQLTIGDCPRLVPFLPGPWASSLPLWPTCTNDVCLINPWRMFPASLSPSLILWPTVSRPVCFGKKHPSGAYDQIFITVRLLRVCWCGTLSLTRGRVCNLLLLLALASAVIFGSESRGTRDHILLSQIGDFPFRRLLWLAGLWSVSCKWITFPFITWCGPETELFPERFVCFIVRIPCHGNVR